MLNKLRNFSKSKLAIVLVAIIIVPFVFWGMGSVFSGGNKNNLVEINNTNISVQDFIEHINKSRINTNDIKNNLDKNIIEEILSQIISLKILEMEINEVDVSISDQTLSKIIKSDNKFYDDNKKFSRIKYEKFLIENNISAVELEKKIKESKLQENLFKYISGGIKSPNFFIKNNFLEENKEIRVKYINLENIYKKNFSDNEIDDFIKKNSEDLYREYIDISYAIINPENLTNSEVFNDNFFKMLDDIENDISNGSSLLEISKNYNFQIKYKNNFFVKENDEIEKFFEIIYNNKNLRKIDLIDLEDFYVIYEINNIKRVLPENNDKLFVQNIIEKLQSLNKFNFNKEILRKIETNNFNNEDFVNIAGDSKKIKNLTIKSKNDNSFFNVDSLKLLYTIPENDYLLIIDNDNKVYLTKVISFKFKNINENSEEFKKYLIKTNYSVRDNLTSSYDLLLNDKYNVKVNQNTLERVKNNFK